MRIQPSFAVLFAVVFSWSMHASPVQAQRVFVSATGSDSNPCSFGLPCRSFQHAHDVAASGGEIDVLDPAGYGPVTITKAISIQGHGFSGISVPNGGTGITISAGVNKVYLSGLIIDGAGLGQAGISFTSGAFLTIKDCVIRNLTASGIAIVPTNSAVIAISNTLASDNGGHGIFVQPASSGSGQVNALFNRVEVYNNAQNGIGIYGNFAPQFVVRAKIVDSVAYDNTNGFYAFGGGVDIGNVTVSVLRSATFANHAVSIFADSQSGIFVAQSSVDLDLLSTGTVVSYGDNYSTGSAFPGTVPRE